MSQNLIPEQTAALEYRTLPTFDSLADEREYRKQRLAAGFRLFSKAGFDEGVAGHITARDPEFPDRFWVNPYGMHFSQIRASNLICVDDAGEVVEGRYPVNAAAFCIHSQVHQARPDVVAAAHSHSVHGKALSCLGVGIEPLTQDACAFFDDHAVFEDYTGVVYDVEEGKRIAHALGDTKAVILRNHGLLTVGDTVDAAVWWFMTLERTCQAQLLAMATGMPRIHIDAANATKAYTVVGSQLAGWFQAQPLFDRIIAEQPDCLD